MPLFPPLVTRLLRRSPRLARGGGSHRQMRSGKRRSLLRSRRQEFRCLIKPVNRRSFVWPFEYEARDRWYCGVSTAILADEDKSGSAIGYAQNDLLAGPGLDRVHSNGEKFTHGLVKILKPQLRADLCCCNPQTEPLRARVNCGQGHSVRNEAKRGRRYGNEIDLLFSGADDEGRPCKDFRSSSSDMAADCIQRVAKGGRT